jgi:KUP system potassium uptake protein
MHEQVVLLTVEAKEVAHVTTGEHLQIESLGEGVYRMTLSFGFMDEPHVPHALADLEVPGLNFDPRAIIYFIGRSSVIASNIPGMALWREKFFALLSRNAATASDYFSLPPQRVVEIGTRVEF